MTDPTTAPDEEPTPHAPTYRHAREDVLAAIARVTHLLEQSAGIPGEEALPVRLGPPLPSDAPGRSAADAWNLRVLVEELAAQIEEADDRARHRGQITVDVVPRITAEGFGEFADEVAAAISAQIIGSGTRPVGISSEAVDRDAAVDHAVTFLAGQTTDPDVLVDAAAKLARFLSTGEGRGPVVPRNVSSTRLAEWLDEGSLDGELWIAEVVGQGQAGRVVFRLPIDHLRRIVGYVEAVKGGARA